MKTSVMEVRDMLSVLSVLGVEQRIGEVPGVESVTVNFAAGSATVRFDETRLSLADIRSDVRQSGSKADAAQDGVKAPKAPDAPAAVGGVFMAACLMSADGAAGFSDASGSLPLSSAASSLDPL